MKFYKNLLAILLTAFLTCCTPYWYKPFGYRAFSNIPKSGTPGLKLGWIHGCYSGLGSQYGGAFMMTFYTWARDPDITSEKPDIEKIKKRYPKELKDVKWNDPADIKKNFSDYNGIFWHAHGFCHGFILGTLQSGGMTPPYQGQVRYNPTAHSVSNVWRLYGKGDTRIGATGLW